MSTYKPIIDEYLYVTGFKFAPVKGSPPPSPAIGLQEVGPGGLQHRRRRHLLTASHQIRLPVPSPASRSLTPSPPDRRPSTLTPSPPPDRRSPDLAPEKPDLAAGAFPRLPAADAAKSGLQDADPAADTFATSATSSSTAGHRLLRRQPLTTRSDLHEVVGCGSSIRSLSLTAGRRCLRHRPPAAGFVCA
uniref:Uncharacterized protein n=1 Tax=Oryza sativa subsp. japonica TaxID=39947 RepID=Q8H366_ORYSJ|nr:hypothetical protein [Oryza sativa Japonica Group]